MTGHRHQYRWDHTHHISEGWWDKGKPGIEDAWGNFRTTDEIYKCAACEAHLLTASLFTQAEIDGLKAKGWTDEVML